MDAELAGEPGDPVRDHARLAAAGAGQDEQRSITRSDGLALWGVQILEEVLQLGRHRLIVQIEPGLANTKRAYSTVTLFARFRG